MIDKNYLQREFIRLLVDEDLKYAEIEKELGLSNNYAKVKVNRLKRKGIIESKSPKGYQLTKKGNQFYRAMSRVITTQGQNVNIHFHKIRAKVLEYYPLIKGKTFIKNIETIIQIKKMQEGYDYTTTMLKNNKIYIFEKLIGSEIRATTRHILIKVPKLTYSNLDSCLKESEEYFNEVLPKIENFFHCKLDTHFINQYWLSSRHIEYVEHSLGLLHKKYGCMDIEVLNAETNERELYFDKSNGKINTETASIRKGVDVAYNLEKLDNDIVQGYSMSANKDMIQDVKTNTIIELNDIKQVMGQTAITLDDTAKRQSNIMQILDVYKEELNMHLGTYKNMGVMAEAMKLMIEKTQVIKNMQKQQSVQSNDFFNEIGITNNIDENKLESIKSKIHKKTDVLNLRNEIQSLNASELSQLSQFIINKFD